MKLKAQPPLQKRRAARAKARARPRVTSRGAGRQARRPGVPLRRRIGARLPSFRRLLAGVGAVAAASVLVALLNGPWLLVSDVAWAGNRYTAAVDLRLALDAWRGTSILAVDTAALREEIEGFPAVASASVTAGIGGRLEATVAEHEAAFIWETPAWRYLGAPDGTIFARESAASAPDPGHAPLPHIGDVRSTSSLLTVGDEIPAPLLRVALRVAALDPALVGSDEPRFVVQLDDEFGFRLVATEEGWEAALGVFGIDPRETDAEADGRLERQIAAVRTLFASHPEDEIGWVDARNPGRVYFRAKG